MLRVAALTDAEYTISAVAEGLEEYYLGHGEAPGVWAGTWAGELGLSGVVGHDDLRALVDGHDPEVGTDLLAGKRGRRDMAFDATFSAPKSVSLLWAFGSPQISSVVVRAHVEAVAQALAFVEGRAAKYGWIAYFELIGRLADAGRIRDQRVGGARNVTPDIDPSFPDEPPVLPLPLPEWAPTASMADEVWLRTGAVHVPAELWSPEEIYGVAGGWLLVEGFLEHKRDGRRVWGFFRTLLLEPADVDPALEMIGGLKYLGNDFFPELPTVRGVFAGEVPWSPRFEVRFEDGDDDTYSRPALRRDWRDEGIGLGQVAVELSTGEGGSPTVLTRSYDVPSFEFAARFGLRQLPGTLDLVGFDGVRASATFRAEEPWRGHLLFVRRDLVADFAGDRRIVRVGWGEREVTVDWSAVPAWVREVHQSHENMWRDIRVFSEP